MVRTPQQPHSGSGLTVEAVRAALARAGVALRWFDRLEQLPTGAVRIRFGGRWRGRLGRRHEILAGLRAELPGAGHRWYSRPLLIGPRVFGTV